MSLAFIRSDFARKVVSAVCLLTFPAAAQQPNTGLQSQAAPRCRQQTAAPRRTQEPRAHPPNTLAANRVAQPAHMDYSTAAQPCESPFARYIPRDVSPPSFTNA